MIPAVLVTESERNVAENPRKDDMLALVAVVSLLAALTLQALVVRGCA
jgi:hypothetical protein